MTPADWIAAEVAAGRTELKSMLERAPFPTAAVRTVAETGDFRIIDGHVSRGAPVPATWFPPAAGQWSFPLRVTEGVLAGEGVEVPMAVGNLLCIPRGGFTTLTTAAGPVGARLMADHVLLGPIHRLIDAHPGDLVDLAFSADGTLAVYNRGTERSSSRV